MSQTFQLCSVANQSNTSELKASFDPPIILDDNKSYVIGLQALNTSHAIPNIHPGFNKLYLVQNNNSDVTELEIPTGTYELSGLNDAINLEFVRKTNEIKRQGNSHNAFVDDIEAELTSRTKNKKHTSLKSGMTPTFELFADKHTLRAILISKYNVDFTKPDTFASLLGFEHKVYPADQIHKAEHNVWIFPTLAINVYCNLTADSYINSRPAHYLYSFVPDVPPGYRIHERPGQIDFKRVIVTKSITEIVLRLDDHNGKLVDLRKEPVCITLILKEDNGT